MKRLNPVIPMGAISGEMSNEELTEMMRRYAQGGIEQFLLYGRGRTAKDVEYMSAAWLRMTECILSNAKKLDMKVWLYDEFGYPSGIASGLVMKNRPEFCAKYIEIKDGKYEIKDYMRYVDVTSSDAIDYFISITHEVYYTHFKEYFSSTILGIFTDEPSFVYGTELTEEEEKAGIRKLSYSVGMENEYRELTGRDYFGDALVGSDEFYRVHLDILSRRFKNNYIKKINDWCDAHGIMLTGHLYEEVNMRRSQVANGDVIKALRGFSFPGMDEIFTRIPVDEVEWITLGVVQAASREIGRGALAELTALGPTDQPPGRFLQMIRLCALFGVSHYVAAIAPCDGREAYGKNEWFHPTNYLQPWFEGMKAFSDIALEAAKLTEKTILPEVFVRFPADYTAAHFSRAEQTSVKLIDLLRELVRNQYQWQFLAAGDIAPENTGIVIDFDTPIETVISKLGHNCKVVDGNGGLAEEIMLRRYTDNSVCVLDLRETGEPRKLTLQDSDGATEFVLNAGAMYTKGGDKAEYSELGSLDTDFSLSLDRPNTLRCCFPGDVKQYSFTSLDRLDGVRLYRRDYAYDGKVSIDGREIEVSEPCGGMVYGMSQLYRQSEPFTLEAGRHTVTISKSAVSEAYIPALLVAGSFAVDSDDRIGKLPEKVGQGLLSGSTLAEFTGKITLTADIEVPAADGGLLLSFDPHYLMTRVTLGGIDLGTQMLYPYAYEIPAELRGKTAKLVIEQFTTLAPMLGRIERIVANPNAVNTLNIYFSKKFLNNGVDGLKWLKR